jgi:hypothetical protein
MWTGDEYRILCSCNNFKGLEHLKRCRTVDNIKTDLKEIGCELIHRLMVEFCNGLLGKW